MNIQEKSGLSESELAQFTCTTQYYHSLLSTFVYTDGIKYLAEKGDCYWLLSDISAFQYSGEMKNNKHLQSIQFWTLKANEDRSANLICEQDTGITIFESHYAYTSFPLSKISLYLCDMSCYWNSAGQKRGNKTSNYGKLILPTEY